MPDHTTNFMSVFMVTDAVETQQQTRKRVIVVGGGLAGMSAAVGLFTLNTDQSSLHQLE